MKYTSTMVLVYLLLSTAIAEESNQDENLILSAPIIVITGTQTEKLLAQSPVPIQIVSRQAIDESGSTQLNELLKKIPGIQLNDQHGQQGQSVMMQGMDSQHVLILIDGIPVSQTTGDINTERFSLQNIERIEIVPGSSSALYGSSAMGGVINIITSNQTINYLNGSVSATQTESDISHWPTQLNTTLSGGRNWHGLFLEGSGAVTQYSGADITPDTYEEEVASGYRWNLSQNITKESLSARFSWLGGRLSRPYLQELGPNTYERLKVENSDEFTLLLKREVATNTQSLQLDKDNYESIQDLITTEAIDFKREASTHAIRGASNWTAYAGNHEITLGTVAHWSTIEQASTTHIEVPYKDQVSSETFIQDDWFANDSLEIISGIRAQWNNDYNWYFSPKISARWDARQTEANKVFIRTSTGLGYRVPSLKERYYEFDHSQYGYRVIGNAELQPEQSWSSQFELGGEVSIGIESLDWSATIFRQEVTDLITTSIDESISNGLDNYAYQNIDSALIQGVDLNFKAPVGALFGQDISWYSSIQYLEAKNGQTDTPLNHRPNIQVYETLRIALPYRFKPVANFQWQYTGQQFIDSVEVEGFHQVNINTQFQITPRTQINFSVDNLLNHYKQTDVTNAALPTLGRTWRIALSFK